MYTPITYTGQKEGEACGPCFCSPAPHAGMCAAGLECKDDSLQDDIPGYCIRSGNFL